MLEPIEPILSQPQDLLLRGNPADAIRGLRGAEPTGDPEKVRDVARQFEGILLQQVLKQMKEASAPLEDESEDSSSEQIKSMYWSFWADAITERGGLGMWKQIYKQLADVTGQTPGAAAGQLDESV